MKTLKKHIVILGFLFPAFVLAVKGQTNSHSSDDYKNTVHVAKITVQPAQVPVGSYNPLHVKVEISGGAPRKGYLWVNQTDTLGLTAATVYNQQLNFEAGQQIVEGDLRAVYMRPGTVHLEARVKNYSGEDSTCTTSFEVVKAKTDDPSADEIIKWLQDNISQLGANGRVVSEIKMIGNELQVTIHDYHSYAKNSPESTYTAQLDLTATVQYKPFGHDNYDHDYGYISLNAQDETILISMPVQAEYADPVKEHLEQLVKLKKDGK